MSAWQTEQGIQSGALPKVGVNRHRMEEEQRDVQLHEYQPERADESIRRTNAIRASRDAKAVAESLEKVHAAAENDHNVMPAMMEAVRAYATVGEITKVLKQVFGEFREPVGL